MKNINLCIYRLLNEAVTNKDYTWIIIWNGCKRTRASIISGNVPSLAWRDWGKPENPSGRRAGVQVEIGTENVPNIFQKHYRLNQFSLRKQLAFHSEGQEIFLFSTASTPALGTSNEYRGLFPRGVKLTTHLHLVPRLRMVELYLHSPMSLWHSA
jgi:hypothetical protein